MRHAEQYPVLGAMIEVSEAALVQHFKDTGEVPPGVKMIEKARHLGTNVTGLRVLHGPIPPKEKKGD